jgi:hypothetical protein
LNKDETKILYSNFDEVFDVIFELELQNKKLRKKFSSNKNNLSTS